MTAPPLPAARVKALIEDFESFKGSEKDADVLFEAALNALVNYWRVRRLMWDRLPDMQHRAIRKVRGQFGKKYTKLEKLLFLKTFIDEDETRFLEKDLNSPVYYFADLEALPIELDVDEYTCMLKFNKGW